MKRVAKVIIIGILLLLSSCTFESNSFVTQEESKENSWWVGTYRFDCIYIDGLPDEREKVAIQLIKNEYPYSQYGDEIVLAYDGTITDTEWGKKSDPATYTSVSTYIIEDGINKRFGKYGTGEQLQLTRPAASPDERTSTFIVTEDGILIQWMGGSDNFLIGWKFHKVSD